MVSSITNMLQPLEQSPPSSFVECISKLHEKVHVRRIPQSMHSTIHRYEPFQCFFSMLMFNIICNQHIASYSIDRNQSIRILRQALVAHIFEPFQSFFNQKNEKTTPEIDNLSSPLKKSASTPTLSSLILIQNTINLLHLVSHDCFGLPINNTHPDRKNSKCDSYSRLQPSTICRLSQRQKTPAASKKKKR